MRSVDSLLNDLIAQVASDQATDPDAEEYSPKVIYLRDQIAKRCADGEDGKGSAEVRPVPRAQDPADHERGVDLHRVRRVAAEAGPTEPGEVTTDGAHHIMTGDAMLVVPGRENSLSLHRDPWFAAFFYWACGPHQVQGMALSRAERSQQIADHMGR